jgi:hypothetical protein
MTDYEPCTRHLERLRCVHCGEQITEEPYPAAMREHIAKYCQESAREGSSLWYDAAYISDAGAVICLDCLDPDHYVAMPDPDYPDLRNLYYPVTVDDEADSYSYCDACMRPLTYHRLTSHGRRYEAEHALEAARDDDARELLAQVIEDANERELRQTLREVIRAADVPTLVTVAVELTDYQIGARSDRQDRLQAIIDDCQSNASAIYDAARELERYTQAPA